MKEEARETSLHRKFFMKWIPVVSFNEYIIVLSQLCSALIWNSIQVVFAVLLHMKICSGSSLSITSESFTLMATPLAVDDAVDTGYFIGWFLSELKGS